MGDFVAFCGIAVDNSYPENLTAYIMIMFIDIAARQSFFACVCGGGNIINMR